MSEHAAYVLVPIMALIILAPTMFMGHFEYRVVAGKEYPKRPGEPGIRYVLRTAGIILYYGLGIWKDFAVAAVKNIASTIRWLAFGREPEVDENEQ